MIYFSRALGNMVLLKDQSQTMESKQIYQEEFISLKSTSRGSAIVSAH